MGSWEVEEVILDKETGVRWWGLWGPHQSNWCLWSSVDQTDGWCAKTSSLLRSKDTALPGLKGCKFVAVVVCLFCFTQDNSRSQDKLVGDVWGTSKSSLSLTTKVFLGCLLPTWPLSLRLLLHEACSFLASLETPSLLSQNSAGPSPSRMPSWVKPMALNPSNSHRVKPSSS